MRFIVEYDVELSKETKVFIVDSFNESMVCPNGNSVQYCLEDIMNGLKVSDIIKDDYDTLKEFHSGGVDYIEIVW